MDKLLNCLMIILVSDIHLTDTAQRSTFHSDRFFKRLGDIVSRAVADRITAINLVFLGDIFEILKSQKWLDADVRPWQKCKPLHIDTVEQIFKGIVSSNKIFFEELNAFLKRFSCVRVDYVPGNHDWPLNTEMGAKARVILQDIMPLPYSNGEVFRTTYDDPTHHLIAMHGHDWDPANRYGDTTVAIGDAIVIELILRLPLLISQRLGIPEDDPLLDFIHEIDNIRPHTLRVIAQWTNGGLRGLDKTNPRAYKEIDRAFSELVQELLQLEKHIPFGTFATNTKRLKIITRIFRLSVKSLGFLRVARFLPSSSEGPGSFRDRARDEFATLGNNYRYIVCGHTHIPMVVPIDPSDGSATRLYINTGTWRRVRPLAHTSKRRSKEIAFACWDEECMVSIFNSHEQEKLGFPSFQFHRLTSGEQL